GILQQPPCVGGGLWGFGKTAGTGPRSKAAALAHGGPGPCRYMIASRLNSKNSGSRKREWSARANASNDCWIERKDDLHHLFLIELQRTARPVFGSIDSVPHQDVAKLIVDPGLLHAILKGMAERIDDVLLR